MRNSYMKFRGLSLRYLIGADADLITGNEEAVTVLPFDCDLPVERGKSIAYGNLLDELFAIKPCYGPYLSSTDTAREYKEGRIDPKGPGWKANLEDQFTRRVNAGFDTIELDNADSYEWPVVLRAIDFARECELGVIAKNPLLLPRNAVVYVQHPNVYGIIVERDAGVTARLMHDLRVAAGKPDLPIWFVGNQAPGHVFGLRMAAQIGNLRYNNMSVTYSPGIDEYASSFDIYKPHIENVI